MNRPNRKACHAVAAALLGLVAVSQPCWAEKTPGLVVIGDSLSDPGNFFGLTGWFPPSPPYAQRFSNGPVWAEYFAADLGIPLDDRAVGGAMTGPTATPLGVISNFENLQYPGVFAPLPGMQEEVDALLADNPGGLDSDSLYVVWGGGNDFFVGLQAGPAALVQLAADAVENLAGTVCRLGAAGARHFAVANLPDVGATPLGRSLGAEGSQFVTYVVSQFNAGLAQAVAALPPACARTVVLLDSFNLVKGLEAAPTAFGLTDVVAPCLVNTPAGIDFNPACLAAPDTFLYWDEVHPTTAGHRLFATAFEQAICGTAGRPVALANRPGLARPPEVCGERGVRHRKSEKSH